MSEPIVEVRNLVRTFGDVRAVDGVSFDIEAGQVVGFIGENGAGKTTTMRMMVTLDLPNEGTIRICGHDTVNHPNQVRKKIGWMPDSYGAYEAMDVWEYMDFFGRAYGYTGKELEMRVGEVMEFTELTPLQDRPVKHLSKGQAQRLCLARTLVPDPEVLVLDEPAAGLDPRARIEVKNLVRILAGEKKTLFISSHILSELEQMCDALLFISKGRIVHQGSSDSLKGKEGETAHLRIRFSRETDVREWCSLQQGVEFLEQDRSGARIRMENATLERLQVLLKKMVDQDLPVCGFFREEVRLEDAFVDLLNTSERGGL
jgi:ABC-2 type transport system ATP-binding protein